MFATKHKSPVDFLNAGRDREEQAEGEGCGYGHA